jgi:hypothetical protein
VAGGDVTTRPRRRARADILFLLCKIYCEDVVMHSWKSFITKGFFSVPCNVFHEIAGFLLFLVNLNQLESFFMPFIFSSFVSSFHQHVTDHLAPKPPFRQKAEPVRKTVLSRVARFFSVKHTRK